MAIFNHTFTWRKNTNEITEVMPQQNMGFWRSFFQALQHLLTAAGANIVAPILMGISASMALFTSGIGTIIYTRLTGIPAYMGTSFSYIGVIALAMATTGGNQSVVGGGIIAAGLTTIILGIIIKIIGYKWINRLMPPIVLAFVVIAIGLLLAPVAFSQAASNPILALITLGLGIIFAAFFKKGKVGGFIGALPILFSITIGYLFALVTGQVDTSQVAAAPVFTLPTFFVPSFDLGICISMSLITATAVLMEHLGHLKGTGSIVGKDYMPLAGRSLIADGISNMLSWAGTPSVTYGENMGVFAITRVFSLKVMYLAGILAALAGFMGKLTPLVLSIPSGVLGGATFLLFGMIAWSGFNLFQSEKIEMAKSKPNQIITAVMGSTMVIAILVETFRSGVSAITPEIMATLPDAAAGVIKNIQVFVDSFQIGSFALPGLVGVAGVGILLNLILNWKTIFIKKYREEADAEYERDNCTADKAV